MTFHSLEFGRELPGDLPKQSPFTVFFHHSPSARDVGNYIFVAQLLLLLILSNAHLYLPLKVATIQPNQRSSSYGEKLDTIQLSHQVVLMVL